MGTRALLLVIEDVDVPLPRPLVHTVAVLAPELQHLDEGDLASASGVRFARAGFGRTGYQGPRPLAGHGQHRYLFELFALNTPVNATSDALSVLAAASEHVLARGRLIGVDER